MQGSLHFYLVFNPLLKPTDKYLSQGHEFHDLLKKRIQKGNRFDHMWWGKIKKTDKNPPLNFDHYEKVLAENKAAGVDTYLFISDFNFLWVAKIDEVSLKRPANHETLSIYQKEDVEMWFKVKDFDLLCANPTSTRAKLAKFSLTHSYYPGQKLKSLNPYIGGLRYPLIVDDVSADSYFAKYKDKKRVLLDNPLIEESSHVDPNSRFFYTIPQQNFKKLPTLMKKKILWAEELFSQVHDQTPKYEDSLSKVSFAYLRILEAVMNFSIMREVEVRVGAETRFHNLTTIYEMLNTQTFEGHPINELMKNSKYDDLWQFCTIDVRNFLHIKVNGHQLHAMRTEELVSPEAAMFVRNSMLGVGCKGILNQLIEFYEEMQKLEIREDEFQQSA